MILLGYFLPGVKLEKLVKKLPYCEMFLKPLTYRNGFWLAMSGISFLAAIGASSFTVARIDLVPAIAINPVGFVIETGRYVCFSIMPYLFFLDWLQIKFGNKKWACPKVLMGVCFLALVFHFNYLQTRVTIQQNESINYSGAALLSGVAPELPVAEGIFPGFQGDWYWKDEVPAYIEDSKRNYNYLWKNRPEIGTVLDKDIPLITVKDFALEPFVDENHNMFYGKSTIWPGGEFAALVDDDNKVVGYAHRVKTPGIHRSDGQKLYFYNSYEFKGFIQSDISSSDKLYILDGEFPTRNQKR